MLACRTQPARQPLGLRTLQRVPREHPVPSRLALVRCMRLYSGSRFCWSSLLFQRYRCKNKSRSFIVHTSSLFRRPSTKSVTPWLPTDPAFYITYSFVACSSRFTHQGHQTEAKTVSFFCHHTANNIQALLRQNVFSVLKQFQL